MGYKILFILLIAVVAILPQNTNDNITTEFQIGINLFQSYQYDEALRVFTRIADEDLNQRTTAAILFEGKIDLLQSNEPEALVAFNKLFMEYPSSKYIDEAHMSLADYYLENSMYGKSLIQLCSLILNTKSPANDSLARSIGEKITFLHLNNNILDSLLTTLTSPRDHTYLLWLKGKLNLLKNNPRKAKECFTEIVLNYPRSVEKNDAAHSLISLNLPDENNGSLLGVILPAYQKDTNYSRVEPSVEILEGIKFAVSEYNSENNNKIGLLIRDSERKTEKIKGIKEEFDKLNSIKAIIGPVYSDEVKTALEIFKNSNIPIISPTATENDLTSSYPNFFQANPSFILRGEIMAQYIYFVENKKKIALLFPEEGGSSSSVANAFKNEFIKLGGKIIIELTYSSNSYDLSSQISKIQARVKDIQGLYVPLADKADASIILSQLEQQGINLTLYGNQDWLSAKGFESSSTLSNQLIFTSDYFIDYDDPNYQAFNKTFYQKTHMDLTRNVLYGYDAAKFVLASFYGGDPDRQALKTAMESGKVYSGYHNNICFDSERVNKFLNIIRYRDGKFQLVDKFRIGEQ
jgi:branched-chain amino acid transport system substrate-binding protein